MPPHDECVEFESVRCISQTQKAILVRIDDKEHWIPQTMIDDDSEVWRKGDEGTLVIREWFAVKEGLV